MIRHTSDRNPENRRDSPSERTAGTSSRGSARDAHTAPDNTHCRGLGTSARLFLMAHLIASRLRNALVFLCLSGLYIFVCLFVHEIFSLLFFCWVFFFFPSCFNDSQALCDIRFCELFFTFCVSEMFAQIRVLGVCTFVE